MERLSIDFAGTFDLAQWCKLLRDRGWTGHQVARSLGRSEGYVNNLIRILERASLEVLARWKTEQAPGSGMVPICATDWLMQVCVLPHDEQLVELGKRIERLARAHGSRPPTDAPRRPTTETDVRRATDTDVPGGRRATDDAAQLAIPDGKVD